MDQNVHRRAAPLATPPTVRRALGTLAMTLSTVLSLVACEDEPLPGDVTVMIYGEEFIEQGLTADDMDDGWSVAFDRFVVAVEDVSVGEVEVPADSPAGIDIAAASGGLGHEFASAAAPSRPHTDSRFSITRIEVSGSARKDGVVKTFDWLFDQVTDYTACETTTAVPPGGEAVFQVTVHADHFFYDSLVAEEPRVLFQALADADANDDGEITRVELEAQDIGGYDPGSAGGVDELWGWLVAQSRTVGHVDGEGHCASSPRPL